MIIAILISIILGLAFYVYILYMAVEKLKAEKKHRDFSISDGEILSVIQKSEDIAYYRDYNRTDGRDMATHALGAKEWSFRECIDYGMVVDTLKEHQFDVGRDMLGMMLPMYAKAVKEFREEAEERQMNE